MDKTEIVDLVKKIYSLHYSEEEDIEMLNKLNDYMPHALIVNLMFHDSRELTPEQVADEAMQRELVYLSRKQ